MAMKFWFGKKEVEQSGHSNVSCDVLTIPDHAADGGTATSSIFVTPQQRGGPAVEPRSLMVQPVFPAGGVLPEVKAPAATGGAGAEAPKNPAVSVSLKAVPEAPKVDKDGEEKAQVPGSSPSPSAAEAAKTPLRPLGSPVRLAAVPSASAASGAVSAGAGLATPVARGQAVDPSGVAARPTFGLRPKGNAPTAPVTPAQAPAVPVSVATGASAPVVAQPAAKADPERKDANAAAVRPKTDQRALYYELMNGLYDAVLILDDQGHVVDSNTRGAAVLGYTREETWDLPIDKVITGMTSQMFEHLRRNLAENHHVLMDARCFRQDGTSFAGEVGVSTLSLTRGGNLVFTLRNVERRKSAMEEMRKGQAALQIALAPSFVCDTDGFFLIVNQALLDAFGIPDETQAKSVRFVDLLPDAARFFLRASCGEKVRESLRVPTPDGLPVKIEVSLSPVQSGQNITAVAGSILQV